MYNSRTLYYELAIFYIQFNTIHQHSQLSKATGSKTMSAVLDSDGHERRLKPGHSAIFNTFNILYRVYNYQDSASDLMLFI